MKEFKIRSTLHNRDAISSTFWSTIQQLVVASSTYFILEAIRCATASDMGSSTRFIAAFVTSLILVYLPNTLSMVYLQRWRLTSIDSFVRSFADKNFGKTSFGHSRNKTHAEAWITNECFTVYDQATNLLYQLYSTFMNAVLNILVIAVALDLRILFWYLLAGITLMISNWVFAPRIASVASEMQIGRKGLSNIMLTAWDNIFVGNRQNYSNWLSRYELELNLNRKAATRYDLVRSLISSVTVSIALLFVAAGNGIFLATHSNELPQVAALFITLPRQLQIVQSVFAFFNLTLSWTGTYAQMKDLQNVVELSARNVSSVEYVQFTAISLSNAERAESSVESFEAMRALLAQRHAGRFTLRGKNGAGKSTLLSLLKEYFGEKAFYLPTHYADLSFPSEFLNHSDGNRLLSVFSEISKIEGVDVVILDEWDANLDPENIVKIHAAIDELAKKRVVVESRHRA